MGNVSSCAKHAEAIAINNVSIFHLAAWAICHHSYRFFRCRVGRRRGRIRSVTYWQTTLAILALLSVSMALADDFKTIHGKEYKDATIMRVEGDGIVVRTKTGISKLYFIELPKDVQQKFHYGQATPIPVQREPVKAAKEDERRQADKGPRVVVVGQGAGSLKIWVAGIIVVVVVVLAIVRSRS